MTGHPIALYVANNDSLSLSQVQPASDLVFWKTPKLVFNKTSKLKKNSLIRHYINFTENIVLRKMNFKFCVTINLWSLAVAANTRSRTFQSARESPANYRISWKVFVEFTSNFQSILLRKCKKGRFETRKQGLNPQHFTMFLVLVIYKTFEDIIAKRKTIELKTNYHDYRFLKDWPRFYPDNGRYLVSTGGTSSSKDALLSGVTQRTTQAR